MHKTGNGAQHCKGLNLVQGLTRMIRETFYQTCSNQTRGNGFRFEIRKKFFMMKVVRHWDRFPKEVVDTLSLDLF